MFSFYLQCSEILVLWNQTWVCLPTIQQSQFTDNQAVVKERKAFVAGPNKETGKLMLKRPELPGGFDGSVYYIERNFTVLLKCLGKNQ